MRNGWRDTLVEGWMDEEWMEEFTNGWIEGGMDG